MTTAQPCSIDWESWRQRWEAQQGRHLPRREERFRLMLDVVAAAVGDSSVRLLDVASGPGSIAARALARFPRATVVALDADPVLLAIGQGALGGADGRLTWVRADLRDDGWVQAVAPHAPFDAVLSSTALHWLHPGTLTRVYYHLAGLVRPGGILVNADHLDVTWPTGRLAELASRLRRAQAADQPPARGESWEEWWAAVRQEPAFGELMLLRERLFHDHPHEAKAPAGLHCAALRAAGFSEAAVIWRYLDDTMVAALR